MLQTYPMESRPDATILIVEDDANVSSVMTWTLEQAGYKVMVAKDGDTAFQICLQAGAIDLLIADVVLPGITGIDLGQLVQAQSPNTKVIIFSGEIDPQTHALKTLKRGTAFLQKPFTPEGLLEVVQRTLAKS
jgi:DNA-binding NtrC family response regulator